MNCAEIKNYRVSDLDLRSFCAKSLQSAKKGMVISL